MQLLVSGLAVGSVYALVGLAFIMVNEATGVVNFATGQMVTIGCFLAVITSLQMGLPLAPAYALALVAMAFFGVVFYAVVFRPLQDRPVVTVIIGTVMIGIVIQNSALMTWGSVPFRPRSPFGRQVIDVFGAALSAHALFVIVVAFLMIAPALSLHLSHRHRRAHAGGGAGPRRGAPDGHRRRSHVRADLDHRRPAGRPRRAAVGAHVARRRDLRRHARPQGLRRYHDRRLWQRAGRDHRRHHRRGRSRSSAPSTSPPHSKTPSYSRRCSCSSW